MREVAPGDGVFSFTDTLIAAIGIARSYCYESPKPTEFGTTGSNWGPLQRMGIRRSEKLNVGAFSEQQRAFLDYHRENVFREAVVRR